MSNIKVLKQALDALESGHTGKEILAMRALRQAIKEAELADAFAEDFPNTWGKRKHAPQQANLLTQICCECGKSGGYALYCVDCAGRVVK